MSPQPTTAPADTPAVEHPKGSPAWLVQQAKDLEKERGKLMEKIGANRTLLRSLHKAEALSDEFVKFVETFYPEKEKGTARDADKVEATRKAREAARKA